MALSDMKRVLILDINTGGHHPFWVRAYIESRLVDSVNTIVASQKEMFLHAAITTCTLPFRRHQIDLESTLWLYPRYSGPLIVMRRSWELGKIYRKVFLEHSRSERVDLVIVPYVDNCLLGLAAPHEAFGGTPWLGLTMLTMFHYPSAGVKAPRQSFSMLRRWLTN